MVTGVPVLDNNLITINRVIKLFEGLPNSLRG